MSTFSRDEIVPSSKASRNFSSLLNKLKEHKLEKVAILRNNEMEAIILPIEEYERMQNLLEIDEYKNTYSMIKERNTTQETEYIEFKTVLSNLGIQNDSI